MTETTDLAGLLEQGRALLARDEIGRPVAIHGSGCPDDGTVNLWDAHERLLMDSMSEGEANEIAWWLNNGPALLDAAQSAQERAKAAEKKHGEWFETASLNFHRYQEAHAEAERAHVWLDRLTVEVDELLVRSQKAERERNSAIARAEAAERERGILRTEVQVAEGIIEDLVDERDTARAENAALREALVWYADSHQWVGDWLPDYIDNRRKMTPPIETDGGVRARAALSAGEGTA